MSISEDLDPLMKTLISSVAEESRECRDDAVALRLKLVAMVSILAAGTAGVAIPLVGRGGRADGTGFLLAKAFAAGVILATGFVHMMHDAEEAFLDTLVPAMPWRKFPFAGFVAMVAALGTLLVDFVTTQWYEGKEKGGRGLEERLVEEGDGDKMHIVGMHAHAAAHRHGHGDEPASDDNDDPGHPPEHARHAVVSQILELGIVSHSVIIGLSLGVSQSPCTIRPLIAALSFHQFFEGFALGGCISEAQFRNASVFLMASFFAVTTPLGIGAGTSIASFYNANSAKALVVEGFLDSVSAGILIYMALVDLIAADFLSRRMCCNVRLQVFSYLALFVGACAMSAIAIWS